MNSRLYLIPDQNEVGATNACCLQLTKPWKGTGRIDISDLWFGSVNSVQELMIKTGWPVP